LWSGDTGNEEKSKDQVAGIRIIIMLCHQKLYWTILLLSSKFNHDGKRNTETVSEKRLEIRPCYRIPSYRDKR
jgi:hypothetical protein